MFTGKAFHPPSFIQHQQVLIVLVIQLVESVWPGQLRHNPGSRNAPWLLEMMKEVNLDLTLIHI